MSNEKKIENQKVDQDSAYPLTLLNDFFDAESCLVFFIFFLLPGSTNTRTHNLIIVKVEPGVNSFTTTS